MRLRLPLARIVSVLLFAALCAIVVGWALQLLAPRAPIAPAGALAQVQGPPDLSAAGQLFGGVPRPQDALVQAAPSNIQVTGVLASGTRGVALLAIDGRPAKPFAVGEPVSDGMTVRSVAADAVELDRTSGGVPMRLAAPPRGSIAVLTSGPQRPGSGGATVPPVLPSGSQAPSAGTTQAGGPPPLPPRMLPPAGAMATPQDPPPVTPAIAPTVNLPPTDPNAAGLAPPPPGPRVPGLTPAGPVTSTGQP